MRRVAALILVLAATVAAGPASAADLMVVGRSETLVAPRTASVRAAKVRVEGHRCGVAGRTALAALARTGLALGLVDYGACGKPAEAAGLYVRSLAGEAERGADGWVYKLGNATPGIGAGDLAGRFGARDDLLWFWCRNGSTGCQRTLAVSAPRSAAPGDEIAVRVRAYDDRGDDVAAAGALVTAGSIRATAGADGVARLTVPEAASGTLGLVATRAGLVRSFLAEVQVR